MVVPAPQSLPTYSPSVPRTSPETATTKGLSVDQTQKNDAERPKRKVQRYSPDRLLRQKLVLPAATTVSAEKHKGRVMVRFEVPQ